MKATHAHFKPVLILAVALSVASVCSPGFAKPLLSIKHHAPCNLFSAEEPVQLTALAQGFPAGQARATARILNYFGEQVWEGKPQLNLAAGKSSEFTLDAGKLEPGYYELRVSVHVPLANGQTVEVKAEQVSFGVAPLVHRTAAQVRQGGYRFGLKMWYLEDAWWRGGAQWREREALDATVKLGLQWTRTQFNQTAHLATTDIVKDFPMNVVLKIERFPAELYDLERYGPLEAWEKKHGKGRWQLRTIPRKEPYQKWLRAELGKLPPEQNVFEIWNEAWDQMSAEDYAELCQIIVPVVKEVRPNAIIGPNLGPNEFDKRFIAAGGMKGCNMVTVHPYAFSVLPEHRTRAFLRNYHDFLKARLGYDLPLYVTEYGWSTAPQDKRKHAVTEALQAQRTTRQSLMLYAEDIKTLIPHWMADREQDPTEREHWFGFFRLNHQPKPVLMAHATAARMIDGSRFLGDLQLREGIGAMLFERDGVRTLALWTAEEEKQVKVAVDAAQLTVVDIMGRGQARKTEGGELALRLDGNVQYVVGVGPAVAGRVVPVGKDLVPDPFQKRRTFIASRAQTPPVLDGDLADWKGDQFIPLNDVHNSNVSAGDSSGNVWMRWDRENLYAAWSIRDDHHVVAPAGKGMSGGDALEIGIGARPERQPALGGWTLYDYKLVVTPRSAAGKPELSFSNSEWPEPVTNPAPGHASGIRWAVEAVEGGWTGEVSLPVRLLKGFPEPRAGALISAYPQLWDVDPGSQRIFRAPVEVRNSQGWPYLKLAE